MRSTPKDTMALLYLVTSIIITYGGLFIPTSSCTSIVKVPAIIPDDSNLSRQYEGLPLKPEEERASILVNQLGILHLLDETPKDPGAACSCSAELEQMVKEALNKTDLIYMDTITQLLNLQQQQDDRLSPIKQQLNRLETLYQEEFSGILELLQRQMTELKESQSATLQAAAAQDAELEGVKEEVAVLKQELNDLRSSLQGQENAVPTCPENFLMLGSKCIFLSNDDTKLTWPKAREWCVHLGGDLAQPENPRNFINEIRKIHAVKDYWLGGSDIASEGSWLWLSGRSISSDIWASGEPNDDNGNEDCVVLAYGQHALNDYVCNAKARFICERSPYF